MMEEYFPMLALLEDEKSKSWKVEDPEPEYHACPYTGGAVYLLPLTFAKITALMDKFDKEWLAYMIGRWQDNNVIVEDLYIPTQESSGASVSKVYDGPPEGKVGVMHSHVKMGAFFSGTDDQFINSNHDVSIVVSRPSGSTNLVFKSNIRRKVSCGIIMVMEWPVQQVVVSPEIKNWVEECAVRVQNVPAKTYTPIKTEAVQQRWWEKKRAVAVEDDLPLQPRDASLTHLQLENMLDAVDARKFSTPELVGAFNAVFPTRIRVADAAQKAPTNLLLMAISYMERYPSNPDRDIRYTAACKEVLDRLSKKDRGGHE